jgi:hypothetical protein
MESKKSAQERLDELRAKGIRREKPAAPVLAGPWPTPKLSEEEIIRRQQQIDVWWQAHREEEARRAAEPTPEQRLTRWIWGDR